MDIDKRFTLFNKQYLDNDSLSTSPNTSTMSASQDEIIDYYVIKRDGTRAPVRFDSITDRNQTLCSAAYGRRLDYIISKLPGLTKQVVSRFRNGMSTHELDMLTAAICANHATHHPDYSDLSARIMVSCLQKTTVNSMPALIESMKKFKNANGTPNCRLSDEFMAVVNRADVEIARRIDDARDFGFKCIGIQTTQKSYLMRNIDHIDSNGGKDIIPIERPQFMYMRVALFLFVCRPDGKGHLADDVDFRSRLEDAFHLYDLMSTFKISHASPTVFNAGTRFAQLSSCFLLTMLDDSNSISKCDSDAGKISKYAGGVGIDFNQIRCDGQLISSSGGYATGVTWPFLNKFNAGQLYWKQNGGRRNGAYAGSMSPWHGDFQEFIKCGRFFGVAKNAPDIKYAAWISDEFMRTTMRELSGDTEAYWYQFSPNIAIGLTETFGDEFDTLYHKYVKEGKYIRKVRPSTIWIEIFKTIVQRGFPYMLYKDHINNRSNLSHDAVIRCSNLCAEITIPCNDDSYGTCNLGAVMLASYVVPDATAKNQGRVRMNWIELIDNVRCITRSINKVIEMTFYPTPECKVNNDRYRPIAIGIMGLADVFARFKYAFGDKEALALDRAIQAVIYYAAMSESSKLGRECGNFTAFEGCAAQLGMLQPDMCVRDGYMEKDWAAGIETVTGGHVTVEMWDTLRKECTTHLRNGYVTANMPTATSSRVGGQNECFEPYTHCVYTILTLAGENIVLNPHLQAELEGGGYWNDAMRVKIIEGSGSIQDIVEIPADIRRRYRTAREYDQRILLKHGTVRMPFVSQSQSMNGYMEDVTLKRFLSNQVYAWENGMTTGAYYTHTKPATGAFKASSSSTKDNPGTESPSGDLKLNTIHPAEAGGGAGKSTADGPVVNQMCWTPSSFDLDPDEECTSCVM